MRTLFGAILSALVLFGTGPALATTAETCGDAAMESADIDVLSASFDAATGYITVELGLCAPPDNRTKYRIHFDHTAPFATDADRDGDREGQEERGHHYVGGTLPDQSLRRP